MNLAFVLSGLLALGIGAQWLAWYLKQPSILFLLIIGILIGPVFGWFQPDAVLGDLLFPLISLGVAVILFEGSLTLEFHEIRQHGLMVQNLVSIGMAVTIAVISIAAYALFDMNLLIALLFGALVCVTGPTVIAPLLRSVRPKKNIRNILKWEGIVIDPIGAIAVVLVYEYIIHGSNSNSLMLFGKIVLVSAVIGFFGAAFLATVIKRYWLPEYLRNVFTLATVLFLFSLSNYAEHESGLLTVTVLGVALANWPKFPRHQILEFNESLTILLVSMLFIILAARVDLSALVNVGFSGILLLLIVMFIARPLAVWVSAIGTKLTTNEKLMISWIGPRGIVAAAISSLFAIRLQSQQPLNGVELLVPLVFIIIIGTVLIQGLGAKAVGNFLGVREPVNNGILIVGSNPVALKIAQVIKNLGYDVLLADSNYTNTAKARMEGVRTYFGNPVSEHAERNLDLIGIGLLFAMSTDKELNTLCELHFKHEFGEQNLYRLRLTQEKEQNERAQKQHSVTSQWLFGNETTYHKLASLVAKQSRIKTTAITAAYGYEQYTQDNKNAIPLFTIDKNGILRVVTSGFKPETAKDKKIVALVAEEDPTSKN
ncbi:cation:proton antiporter [Stenoxybacter acetivorans]|uniref:cation:proton antiporter n=1 Tax=Stenoxybacter acetivorans TaxID=422441 RepID=UPI00056CCED0|nr:sodium:proton antiporter [Stenoxybacter acetivorans]